jgi:hypothetical protein
MAFTENLSDFINPDTPGYVVATVDGQAVPGIFVNEYAGANLGLAGFESPSPQLHVEAADIAGVEQDDAVVIAAVNYKVASIEPDGTGITVLQLKK